jgi:hypothetical protein
MVSLSISADGALIIWIKGSRIKAMITRPHEIVIQKNGSRLMIHLVHVILELQPDLAALWEAVPSFPLLEPYRG